ncbi:MAG: J domain-containing protein [Bacteroidota bacterium]
MLDEYYSILEVEPGADKRDIKRAYWRLAKQWHPDINSSEEAQEKFILIHQAYDILVNDKPVPHSVVYASSPTDINEELINWIFDQKKYQENYWAERQERAAHFARLQYEEFKHNNELFKNSFWYWPAKAFTYFAWLIGNLAGLSCLFSPIWIAFILGHLSAGITLFPFSLLGFAVIAAAFRFKQDVVERYF